MNMGAVIASQHWDNNHMWGDGGWMWLWGTIMMLFFVAAVGLIIWLVTRATHSQQSGRLHDESGARARGILAERYARGEISTEEYQERLASLR
jgi:putative membrane protein